MTKLLLITLGCVSLALAQAPRPVVGTVVAADAAARSLTVKTDDGAETKVAVAPNARVAQIPPGETSLQKANPAELSAIQKGDRVLARGPVADGVVQATLVVLMSQTDIAKKNQAEQQLWATKGISGIVTAVDATAGTITINARGPQGSTPVTISLNNNASVKRYADGSVKFSEAVASSLKDIEVSDQVRALGTRSEDGASYKADQLVSGAFRNLAVTVRSVNAEQRTIEVIDLDTKKPVTVVLGKDTNLKRLPDQAASVMAMAINGGFAAMRGMGGMGGGAGQGPGASAMRPGAGGPPQGGPPQGAPAGGPGAGGPGGGGMRRGGGDMMSMAIDRSPALELSELKKDDPLILSVSKTKDANKVVAITVLAGVEPILATPSSGSRAMQLGAWNLDGGAGGMMGGMGGGGQ